MGLRFFSSPSGWFFPQSIEADVLTSFVLQVSLSNTAHNALESSKLAEEMSASEILNFGPERSNTMIEGSLEVKLPTI